MHHVLWLLSTLPSWTCMGNVNKASIVAHITPLILAQGPPDCIHFEVNIEIETANKLWFPKVAPLEASHFSLPCSTTSVQVGRSISFPSEHVFEYPCNSTRGELHSPRGFPLCTWIVIPLAIYNREELGLLQATDGWNSRTNWANIGAVSNKLFYYYCMPFMLVVKNMLSIIRLNMNAIYLVCINPSGFHGIS